MLVFTRKRDEAIVIGDGIEIRVLRSGRDGVKLGVTAPPSVSVHRREIYDLIRAENEWAARHATDLPQLVARLRGRTAPRTA
jgi:carbon storage regulator